MKELHESCGVFGIFGDSKAAEKVYLGLYALQHRGQESAGISTTDGNELYSHKGLGLVWSVFFDPNVMPRLKGHAAIGHNRYSTKGSGDIVNAQPIAIQCKAGQIAAAHNGTLVNSAALRKNMEQKGSIFQASTDSEIVLHLIARSQKTTMIDMIMDSLNQLEGAYSFVFLTPDKLIAARDPHGFRPLNLGMLGDVPVIASESCAFDIIGAEYTRSIEPGEVVVIYNSGISSYHLPAASRKSFCIFEHVYFSRPDSIIFGEKVDKVRRNLGKQLAREAPVDADIVIAVPDSANTAALGFSRESGIRYEIGLIRNHYVGRTFIAPHQSKRKLDIKVKINPVTGVIKNKRIVLVDDSIVRGNTLRQIVRLLRSAGAREVHVRISSAPVKFPCYYGIDISSQEELIGANKSVEEIRKRIEADTLAYLSVEGMLNSVENKGLYGSACFTGEYPTAVPQQFDKFEFCSGTES